MLILANRKSGTDMKSRIFTLIIVALCISSCTKPAIRTGDLLFVDDTSSELTKAINDVTQTHAANYTHVGICEVIDNEVFVYHASSEKGVLKEPLAEFCANRKNSKLDVYRIKDISKDQLEMALQNANNMLGRPYDFAYLYGDEKMYCSELIYEIFEQDSIFKLNPMSFKNAETGEFHETWVRHYEKMDMPVPEGELGCNPNDMSQNKRLEFVKTLATEQY